MTTLRASAYVCWLLVTLGGATRWASLRSMGQPGGVLSYRGYEMLSVAGLVLGSVAFVAAVGLHAAEFFATRTRARRRGARADGTCD